MTAAARQCSGPDRRLHGGQAEGAVPGPGTAVDAGAARAQRRRTDRNRTGVPGSACAAAGRSAARTTAITG